MKAGLRTAYWLAVRTGQPIPQEALDAFNHAAQLNSRMDSPDWYYKREIASNSTLGKERFPRRKTNSNLRLPC